MLSQNLFLRSCFYCVQEALERGHVLITEDQNAFLVDFK